jgi:hypothetical protein
MTTINRENILASIESTKGRFFSVHFIKADGSLRKMQCRTGVTKGLRGGKSTTNHKPHLRTVFDIEAGQYRCINVDTMLQMRAFGQTFNLRNLTELLSKRT